MTMPKRNKNLRIREHFFSWKKSSKSAPNFPLCCVQIPFRYGFLFHPHSYIAVFTIDFKRKIGGNKDKNLCHCCLRSRFTIALSIVKAKYFSIGNVILHFKYLTKIIKERYIQEAALNQLKLKIDSNLLPNFLQN